MAESEDTTTPTTLDLSGDPIPPFSFGHPQRHRFSGLFIYSNQPAAPALQVAEEVHQPRGKLKGKGKSKTAPTASCLSTKAHASTTTFQHHHTANWIGRWGFENFRQFDPSCYPLLNQFIGPHHIAVLGESSPKLQHLSLKDCHTLDDSAVLQIVTAVAPHLRNLDLSGVNRLTDCCVQVIAQFCGPWQRLESLRLRNCGLVSDQGLATASEHVGPYLKVLDVSFCRRISDAGLAKFVSKAVAGLPQKHVQRGEQGILKYTADGEEEQPRQGRLVELRFAGCRKFTRGGFNTVMYDCARAFPNLRTVEFTTPHPPKGSPFTMFHNFPTHLFGKLTSLHILRSKFLDDKRITDVADICGSNLRELSLVDLVVSPDTVCYLLAHTPHLTSLSLRNCLHGVTDTVLGHLAQCACAATLEELDLSFCELITSEGLKALTGRHLSPTTNTNTEPTTTTTTTTMNPDNEDNSNNHQIPLNTGTSTRDGQVAPSNEPTRQCACPSLKRLIIAYCMKVKFDGVLSVIRACYPPKGSLEHVDVTGLRNIRPEINTMLRKCLPIMSTTSGQTDTASCAGGDSLPPYPIASASASTPALTATPALDVPASSSSTSYISSSSSSASKAGSTFGAFVAPAGPIAGSKSERELFMEMPEGVGVCPITEKLGKLTEVLRQRRLKILAQGMWDEEE
ncbi:hypothetical protein HK102_009469 [Quaeritorhiza haematococci]|nr:hypothetical protein HK102_009469 [Quaeritorhiza haematococci]